MSYNQQSTSYPQVPTAQEGLMANGAANPYYDTNSSTQPSDQGNFGAANNYQQVPHGDAPRGVESTLDKILRTKHKITHPVGHAKNKIKYSSVGKPVRVVEKLKRLFK